MSIKLYTSTIDSLNFIIMSDLKLYTKAIYYSKILTKW